MRRRYRVERFLERLDQIRDMLGNDPAFSTDIIVGFPGETDAEFEETLETCRKARFMKVHVFPFSRRDGTPAATMPDQVHPDVIKERVHVLSELERGLAEQFYLSRVALDADRQTEVSLHGTPLEVLAERESETRPGYLRGTDRWYMPVEVPGTAADIGNFLPCRAVAANREGLVAERIIVPGQDLPSGSETFQDRVAGRRRAWLNDHEDTSGVEEALQSACAEGMADVCSSEPVELVQLSFSSVAGTQSGESSWPR
jgi:hypothetical protein